MNEEGERISIFQKWSDLRKKYHSVADIPNKDLADYLDQWAELLAYARYQESVVDIDASSLQEIRERIYDQLYVSEDGGRELRAALSGSHETYVAYSEKFLLASVEVKMIKSLRESYEYRYAAVSREVSRRQGDLGNLNRTRGIGGGK